MDEEVKCRIGARRLRCVCLWGGADTGYDQGWNGGFRTRRVSTLTSVLVAGFPCPWSPVRQTLMREA